MNLNPKYTELRHEYLGISFHSHLQEELKALSKRHNDNLKATLKGLLKKFGYTFSSEDDFLTFCKERITKVYRVGSECDFELYLDANKRGPSMNRLCWSSTKIEKTNNGYRVTSILKTDIL